MIRVCSVKLDLCFMSMRMLVDLSLYVRILKLKVDNLQAKYSHVYTATNREGSTRVEHGSAKKVAV